MAGGEFGAALVKRWEDQLGAIVSELG